MKKILIIEHDEVVCEQLKLILADFFPLILTFKIEAGFDILKNADTEIGIVFLNENFIEGNNLYILEEIKTLYPDQPVLIITGYQPPEKSAKAASGYLTKPFKREELLKTVRSFVQE